jgi:hypothetical protein
MSAPPRRPRDKADTERGGGCQIAHLDIVRRKESLANKTQERRVDREVEELEAVAEYRRENFTRFEGWPAK